MKNTLLLLFILPVISFKAQPKSEKQYITNTSYFRSKGLSLVPSGSFVNAEGQIRSVQSFFISNEVSNKEFRIFMNDLTANPDSSISYLDRKDGHVSIKTLKYAEIRNNMIDSNAISKLYANTPSLLNTYANYFTATAFDNYPVLGVTAEGARYYCIWKTLAELRVLKIKNNSLINDYRVPTQEELDYALSLVPAFSDNSGRELQAVNTGPRNPLSIYHLDDNAEELTSNVVSGNNLPKGFRMVNTYLGKN